MSTTAATAAAVAILSAVPDEPTEVSCNCACETPVQEETAAPEVAPEPPATPEPPAMPPRIRQAKAEVKGALDRDVVRRIVRAHINEVRYCYNEGLTRNDKLSGRVVVQWTVGPDGHVPVAVVHDDTTLEDAEVAQCIAKAAKRWKYPRPTDGGNAVVKYPFVLTVDDQ